jgi:predicted RNA binding protein YcfA (HicA-like mRNA interferase family)
MVRLRPLILTISLLPHKRLAGHQGGPALRALILIGWWIGRQRGLHRVLSRSGSPNFVFAFHDNEELGPRMLARIAKHTGLQPDDL